MQSATHKWRFGYGSNIGLRTLREKKNLNPIRYLVGTIKGWELYFNTGLNEYVEPGFAAIRHQSILTTIKNIELHGSAFLIPNDEADGLDQQEAGYNIQSVQFTSYDGEVVTVGLYVPKKPYIQGESKEGIPSYRYLKLLQDGAKEGKLASHWIEHLDSFQHYITPPKVRSQTLQWITEFHDDESRKDEVWSAEQLALHDGSSEDYPTHTSIMGYILKINAPNKQWIFNSWKGHNITRRNLLQYNGKSLDTNDIRYDEDNYRPLPKLCDCSDGEKEYLMQSLDGLLHKGARIVAQYGPFLADQIER